MFEVKINILDVYDALQYDPQFGVVIENLELAHIHALQNNKTKAYELLSEACKMHADTHYQNSLEFKRGCGGVMTFCYKEVVKRVCAIRHALGDYEVANELL